MSSCCAMTSRSSETLGAGWSGAGGFCASAGTLRGSDVSRSPRIGPMRRTSVEIARRRDKAEDAMTYLVRRQALRHGRGAINQADQCAGVVSEARRGAGIKPASAGLIVKDRSGQVGWRRDCGRLGRGDEGEGRRALLMQHGADLAEFFGGCGLRRLRGAINARERPGALGQRYRVVMPAEQKCLKQDRRDADQRDSAAGPCLCRKSAPVHGFMAAGSARRRRRHACVAVTKLVTPTPRTTTINSSNGKPSVSRLWMCSGVLTATSAAPGNASPNSPNTAKASPPQVNVRAAVVSAIVRIASFGRPRRIAQAPNAAPAAACTHSVPQPNTKPGIQPVAADGIAGARVV